MKPIQLLFALETVFALVAAYPVLAQAPPTLGLQLYAGVSITGTVGTVYAIQASSNLTDTNSWMTVSFVQLPATNYLWTDTSMPATGRRFYRALASAPTSLVFIPPGTFRMGSPTNEVGPGAGWHGARGTANGGDINEGLLHGKISCDSRGVSVADGDQPQHVS